MVKHWLLGGIGSKLEIMAMLLWVAVQNTGHRSELQVTAVIDKIMKIGSFLLS